MTLPSLTDFYRTGRWTPTIGDNNLDGTGEGQSYAVQVGRWTKLGNRLFFDGHISITDLGTLTTGQGARILGLPYKSLSATNAESSISVGFASSLAITNAETSVTGHVVTATKFILLQLWDATTGTTTMTVAELSAGGNLLFSGNYQIEEF